MNTTLSALGQAKSWSLIRKLGEGDAGEVFLVEFVLDRRQAILKRPTKSAFSSDIIRQASQIENEGQILRELKGLRALMPRTSGEPKIDIRVPELLDQSQTGTEFSDRFFIIIEKAPGLDLNSLARMALFDESVEGHAPNEAVFLRSIAENKKIPDLILLRALVGILQMFETIHTNLRLNQETEKAGIVWNDVKPDHIFWDPRQAGLMIIDWGNAQFLETDGYNKDRRISKSNDYTQYIQAFGAFIATTNPELLAQLPWPGNLNSALSVLDLIRPLKSKAADLLKQHLVNLAEARALETDFIRSAQPEIEQLSQLFEAQQTILALGELPDFSGAEHFCTQLATWLSMEGKLAEFTEFSQLTCHIHANNPTKWQALVDIGLAAKSEAPSSHPIFLSAISSGLMDDWPSAMWSLLSATADDPEPAWWDDLCNLVRQTGLGIGADSLPPLVVLRRNILLMQAALQKLRDKMQLNPDQTTSTAGKIAPGDIFENSLVSGEVHKSQVQALEALIRLLRDDITVKWEQVEPDPPDCGLPYSDIERLLAEIGFFSPESQHAVTRALDQPKAELKIILEAWESQEFDTSRRGLRRLLMWDPDRRRVLLADQAINRTKKWLEKLGQGPQNGQPLLDYVAELEFSGREIRNQVAPAVWLDTILELLTQLRRGRKPGELMIEYPESAHVLSWLETLEPRRYIPVQPARPISMDRVTASQLPEPTVRGLREDLLGPGEDVLLADPLDTWAPEARGSSARTFIGFLRNPNRQFTQAAIKIMRGDRLEYALPLYREEVQILNLLRDVPGVTPMLECGFIKLTEGLELPPDNRPLSARSLTGSVQRFGPDQAPNFLSNLDSRAHQGWLPYLVMPKLDNQENLMWTCDAGYTRGQFLPVEESLRLAMQICDILHIAHERNIVYRDHKLLHYYWLQLYNGVFMIDWNVARYHPQGLSPAEIQFDLVQLGARALHHIFTGRVAPGALADGPNRVEEIEAAANNYGVQWTYDDQRLPKSLKSILEGLLSGDYKRLPRLRDDLHQVYLELVAKNPEEETQPS